MVGHVDQPLSGTPFSLPEHLQLSLAADSSYYLRIWRHAPDVLRSSMNPVSVQWLELLPTTTPESTDLHIL